MQEFHSIVSHDLWLIIPVHRLTTGFTCSGHCHVASPATKRTNDVCCALLTRTSLQGQSAVSRFLNSSFHLLSQKPFSVLSFLTYIQIDRHTWLPPLNLRSWHSKGKDPRRLIVGHGGDPWCGRSVDDELKKIVKRSKEYKLAGCFDGLSPSSITYKPLYNKYACVG